MAVIIEGYSVIINKALALKNQEALSAVNSVEGTLHPLAICSDAQLLRIAFIDLGQAQEFITELEKVGLLHKTKVNGEEVAQDFAMVTQFGELDVPCPWLSIQFTKLKDNTLICIGVLQGAEPVKGVAFPKGWILEASLLKRYHEIRTDYMLENYDRVGDEPMHDIYQVKGGKDRVRLLKLSMGTLDKKSLQ